MEPSGLALLLSRGAGERFRCGLLTSIQTQLGPNVKPPMSPVFTHFVCSDSSVRISRTVFMVDCFILCVCANGRYRCGFQLPVVKESINRAIAEFSVCVRPCPLNARGSISLSV